MSCPARVPDSGGASDGIASHFIDEIFEFSVCSSACDFAISADGDARGVVSAVGKAPEPCLNNGYSFSIASISDNPAHFVFVLMMN